MQVKTFEAMTMKDAVKLVKQELGADAVLLSSKEKPIPGKEQRYVEVTAAAMKAFQNPAKEDAKAQAHMSKQVDQLDKKITGLETLISQSPLSHIEAGLTDIKTLLFELIKERSHNLMYEVPEYFINTYQQLKMTGINDTFLINLVNQAKLEYGRQAWDKMEKEEVDKACRDFAIREVYRSIKLHTGIKRDPDHSSINVFVGGSGAGKTALVAKIAGKAKAKSSEPIEVVSFKNQKVGGDEALKVYAKIISCPYRAVNDLEELDTYLNRLNTGAVVCIDTPSFIGNKAIENDLLEMSKLQHSINFHLVIALTDRQIQIDRCIARIAKIGIESLCFTKIDESWTFGDLYNQTFKWSIPLSYFSTGSEIPDDLEKASKERVIQKIFGIEG